MPSDITLSDFLALILFFTFWYSITLIGNHFNSQNKNTLYSISKNYRNQWMFNLLGRENRISDVALLGHLMRSASFFASTSLLLLAGLIAVIGVTEQVINVVYDLPLAQHVSIKFMKLKLLLMVMIFVFVFFKLLWSIRQYNSTVIMIGAAADSFKTDAERESYAINLGTVVNRASRHFIEGMRGFEYALAALAWFIHPYVFMFATVLVSLVIYRREYASKTLKAMTDETSIAKD